MASFFRKLVRLIAIILAVIAIVLLVIACFVYAGVGAGLIPAIKGGWLGWVAMAAACAVVAVMLDPEAAMSVLDRCFNAAGDIITGVVDEIIQIGTGVTESLFSAFATSPIGMITIALFSVYIFKNMKGGDDNAHHEQRSQDISSSLSYT